MTGLRPVAIIRDLDREAVIVQTQRQVQFPAGGPRRNAVTDRILHQRLQEKRWYPQFKYLGIELLDHLQPITEPEFLQREIVVQKFKFLFNRHGCGDGASGMEHVAHQLGELLERALRGIRILVRQLGQ